MVVNKKQVQEKILYKMQLFFERISVGKCRNMVLLNPLSGQQ